MLQALHLDRWQRDGLAAQTPRADSQSRGGLAALAQLYEEAKKELLMKEMKNFFSPEFINRIDDTIVFNSLSQEDIKKITDIELKKLMKRLDEMKYKITYDESLLDYLSKIGYDEVYGARPLKRAIQDKVEDLLSEEVLTDKIVVGKTYVIKVEDEVVKVVKKGR